MSLCGFSAYSMNGPRAPLEEAIRDFKTQHIQILKSAPEFKYLIPRITNGIVPASNDIDAFQYARAGRGFGSFRDYLKEVHGLTEDDHCDVAINYLKVFRSNPPEAGAFRDKIKELLAQVGPIDYSQLDPFVGCNIDLIIFDPARDDAETIGAVLERLSFTQDYVRAEAILQATRDYRFFWTRPLELLMTLDSPLRLTQFIEAVARYRIDIDTALIFYLNRDPRTFVDALENDLLFKGLEQSVKDNTFEALKPYRSNPPHVGRLRSFCGKFLNQNIDLDPVFLNSFKGINIDLIATGSPTKPNEKLGTMLDILSHTRRFGAKARQLLKLINPVVFRTKKSDIIDTLRDLLAEALDDASNYNNLKVHVEDMRSKGLKVDCDAISMYTGVRNTIGQEISRALQSSADKANILKIAELFQQSRTNKQMILYSLFNSYVVDNLTDSAYFERLETWFKKYSIDVDTCKIPASKSLGETLDEWLADPVTKPVMLPLAELFRPHRAAEMNALRNYLTRYASDKTVFAELKKWVDEHPFDIDAVVYDASSPDTFGDKVNALKDGALLDLFKAKRSKAPQPIDPPKPPADPKQGKGSTQSQGWLTRNRAFVVGMVGAALYLVYRRTRPHPRTEDHAKPMAS